MAPPVPLTLGPRVAERGGPADWTLVAPLDAAAPARVDGAGLVTPHGADWSLDWWIGADDRWYFPCREAAVRQQRLGPGPVLQTSLRIPSGDAHQRVHGAMVGGREVTVVEIENDSPVPVALALALRPYPLDGAPDGLGPAPARAADGAAVAAPVADGWPRALRLAAPLVTIDDVVVLRLPRAPNQAAAADADLADAVVAGDELDWAGGVTTTATNAVFLFPLPHRTTLRVVLPAAGPDQAAPAAPPPGARPVPDPATVPDHETVARGWSAMVERPARFEFPDPGLDRLLGAARARLLLVGSPALVEDARRAAPDAGRLLEALALAGHDSELRPVLAALADEFPTHLTGSPAATAEVVAALAPMLRAVEAEPEPELLEVATQLTHLIDRAGSPTATTVARRGLAGVARAAGDHRGADHLERRAAGRRWRRAPTASGDGNEMARGLETVMAHAANASDAGSWSGDSASEAARFVIGARHLLIDDDGDELLLLPEFPTSWRGGNAEVHRAPTRHGRLSFGIRWHGARPALLWQLDGPSTTLRCPGLDPDWHTTEPRGETLLAGAAEGLIEPPDPGTGFS